MKRKNPSRTLEKRFVGYGHYELTVTYANFVKTAITSDTDLIARLNSEDIEEKQKATDEAIAFVNDATLSAS